MVPCAEIERAFAMTALPAAQSPISVREKLLQAALEEFAASGFDSATVRGIARRIGMAHSAVRHHYLSKEQLWFAAVDFLFDRLNQWMAVPPEDEEKLRSGDLEIIRRGLRRYVQYCAKHPEHARIMYQESVSPTARSRAVAQTHLSSSHHALVPIAQIIKTTAGLPAQTPAASVIYMVTGACQNLFALASESENSLGYIALSAEAIDAHADAIVALFCPDKQPDQLDD